MTDSPTGLSIEDEPIVTVFSRPAGVKIMTVLNDGAGIPLQINDITSQAEVSRKSVYNNLKILEEYNLVEETDDGWKAIMDSPTTQAFMTLRDALIDC